MEKKQRRLKLKKLNKNKKQTKPKSRKKMKQPKEKILIQQKVSEKADNNTEKEKAVTEGKKMNKIIMEKKENNIENNSLYFAKWIAPEHIKTQEDVIIYYASAVLSIFSIIWFSFQGSLIPVVAFTMTLIVLIIHIYQQPRNIELKIDLNGIAFGDAFYKYANIESFEVAEGEYFDVLKFKLRNSILPVKEIQIIDQNPRYIRAVLENFLPEEKQSATLIGFKKKNDFDEYFSEDDFENYLNEKEKLERLDEIKK